MNALSRAFPALPTTRKARLAYFDARAAARQQADDTYPFKLLYAWADPDLARRIHTTRIVDGRTIGLGEHHEYMRRCFVLRAWCAWKIGWHNETKVALDKAGMHRRLARAARKDGR